MRLFIGFPINSNIAFELERIQRQLESSLPDVTATKLQKLHVTLKFLGSGCENQLEDLKHALDQVTSTHSQTAFLIDTLGYFPTLGRVRSIWAGGESNELLKISHSLNQAFADLGFLPEEKPFHAHVTLARVRRDSSLTARRIQPVIDTLHFAPLTQKIDSIALFQSIPISDGTHYEILHRSSL